MTRQTGEVAFLFADRGELVAEGFEEPVRVYEVSWRASSQGSNLND